MSKKTIIAILIDSKRFERRMKIPQVTNYISIPVERRKDFHVLKFIHQGKKQGCGGSRYDFHVYKQELRE